MKKRNFIIPFMALSLFSCGSVSSSSSSKELNPINLYLVGDSTVCAFDDAYYYPRYGYGTQLSNYFDESVTVKNLALSGRSSKSYIAESNYTTLKNSISSGDYLMIGFGHNDEKNDDVERYTNPTGSVDDTTSFQYYLYTYYIKLALDAGATPILCTPIVRLDTANNYSGSSGHITSDGDYAECIRDLGEKYNITVIDLTQITKDLYSQIGYDEAIYYHAWTKSQSSSVDKTHLNIYGAKNVAYNFACEIKKTNIVLSNYVKEGITSPTKENDLVINPNYVETSYEAFDASTYVASSLFANFTSDGYYGTAFGDTGGSPITASNGFVAEETSSGVFRVGQTGTSSPKGKITSSSDGLAMVFRQVSAAKNFTMSCDIKILTTAGASQQGFGLMVRDDIYVNQEAKDSSIKSNYLASGIVTGSSVDTNNVLFRRENTSLIKESNLVGAYAVDDTAKAKITRIGQAVTLEFIYKEQTYSNTYYDFDLTAIDNNYMYVGMFATRGTTIECTNVNFEITGDAIQA